MRRWLSPYLFMATILSALLAAGAIYAKPGKNKKNAPAAVKPAEPAGSENGDTENSAEPAEGPADTSGGRKYPAAFKPPIVYGKDKVGVTAEGTLSCRYRGDWNDPWGKYIDSYLAEAKATAKARGTTTKKALFAAPIQKNTVVTAGEGIMGGDGQLLRGHWSMPEQAQQKLRKEAREMSDFIYAASEGEVAIDFIFPVLDGLKVNNGKGKAILSIWARGLQDQLLPMLKPYEHAGVMEWIFVSGRPTVENPGSGSKNGFGNGPFGVSYTGYQLYGGYTMATSAASAGLWVHEFNHRYLDGLKRWAGVQLTRTHSQGQLGYAPGHNLDEGYFDAYRYLIRPAMWRRFAITEPKSYPHSEPFSGKAYAWKDVQDDCWFKTPLLNNAELAKLTGIPSIEIVKFGGSARLFKVGEADRSKVLSKVINPPAPVATGKKGKKGKSAPAPASTAVPAEIPVQLDNYIKCGAESCAVLKTASGTWLIVSVNMADLYVDMLKLAGKGDQPLPVYGYVNEGVLPMLVIKAPADMPLPACEEGFFRPVGKMAAK